MGDHLKKPSFCLSHSSVSSSAERNSNTCRSMTGAWCVGHNHSIHVHITLVYPPSCTTPSLEPAYIICISGLQPVHPKLQMGSDSQALITYLKGLQIRNKEDMRFYHHHVCGSSCRLHSGAGGLGEVLPPPQESHPIQWEE